MSDNPVEIVAPEDPVDWKMLAEAVAECLSPEGMKRAKKRRRKRVEEIRRIRSEPESR